jgi:hypothetical protein
MAGTEDPNPRSKGSTTEGIGGKPPGSGATSRPNLIALTIDADTGRIVRVEKLDGARGELSHEDAASLTKGYSIPTLEAALEQAFEAGIACVLGSEADEGQESESEDDAALSRLLLVPLMERTPAHGLLQPGVLGKAIVASAIEQATSHRRSEIKVSPQDAEASTGKPRPPMHQDRRMSK